MIPATIAFIIIASAYAEFLYNDFKCKNEVKRKKQHYEKYGTKLKSKQQS